MAKLTEANIGACRWSLKAAGLDGLLSALLALGLRRVHLALGPLRNDPA